eukprot:CAMPEP_0185366712 /NCGR_PEP_ID=MMETSP1364-20130426/13893_1 /TAXON_ID=38817 /ORGANISM="Gephyrocapsa oceanica, Strain RCC1303" /LENGTH=107 /DNA_ID=CAMNT_0027967311 /DNA_START=102 /DNA_END=422 /DNA_ORIENTATION=-
MTTSAAATNYRDVVGRARDLEAIVESHRSEWAGALQEQRQLSERLSSFADGEWAAWARSETAAEPLPPLLRAGMRVHWLVSSEEEILAALSRGHEARAARRFLEARA